MNESAALNMPANLENSAVATGLENEGERQDGSLSHIHGTNGWLNTLWFP